MTFRIPDLVFLGSEGTYRRYVGHLHLALVVAAGIILAEVLLTEPTDNQRISLIAIYLGVVLVSKIQLHRSTPASALAVLLIGLWIANVIVILTRSGIYASNMLAFPFLILLSGWIVGRRWLLLMIAATLIFVFGVGVAQYFGVLHPTGHSGPLSATVVKVTALVLFSLLTLITFETFNRSRDTAVALSEALAQHYIGLAQREREVNLIMENLGAGMAAFSLDSKLRLCNRRYAAMFGSRPEELIGHNIQDFAPASVLEVFQIAWNSCLNDGKFVSYRRKHVHPVTGAETVIDVELTPDKNKDTIEGLFVLIIDVTEKVRAEEQIRELNETLELRVRDRTKELAEALEKLQRSTEELARSEAKATIAALVASVSHELGTPIGNAVMTASLIEGETKKFLTEMAEGQLKRSELNGFLESLNQGTELMLRNLTRAEGLLTNFKQVSADQASEQRRQFDLATAIEEVLSTLAPTLKNKPHKVELEIPPGILMDSLPGPLGQIVINMINNAFLHAFDGREKGLLKIKAETNGDRVLLEFIDNGVGISQENLEKLFQPFFSTKIGRGGTGLGMTIVDTLVKKSLFGQMAVSSVVSQGTRISLDLPRVLPDAPPVRKRRREDG